LAGVAWRGGRLARVGGPMTQLLYRMGGRAHVADELSRPPAAQPVRRQKTSDGWPIVQVSANDAANAAWWARSCALELGIPAPEVRFYRAPTSIRCGYVDLAMPTVVFVRAGMDLSETRSTIAHEVSHLAGATEREARRYEAGRRRGAWWAPTRPRPAEPTAEDWAMHAARLRARRGA
jgi:hypothetical protein